MKKFSIIVETFIREFFELIKLNILFLIACIPIFTIPAAHAAMDRIIITMVQDQNHYLWHDFQKSFRREFFRSLAVGWPLYLSRAGCCILAVWGFCMEKLSIFFGIFAFVFLILFLWLGLFQCYLFPIISAIDISARQALKNSILLSLVCFPRNLPAVIIPTALWSVWLVLFPWSLPWAAILLFAVSDFLSIFCTWAHIKKYVIQDK